MTVFVIGIGYAEITEDLIVTGFQPDLTVAENDVIFVISDSVTSVLETENLSIVDGNDETVVSALASWIEGVIAVAADHPAVLQLKQQEDVGRVVDELVEVDLAFGIPSVQQLCPLDLQMLFIFDGLYQEST